MLKLEYQKKPEDRPVKITNKYPHDIYVLAKSEYKGVREVRGSRIPEGRWVKFLMTDSFNVIRIFKLGNDEDEARAEAVGKIEQKAFCSAENLGRELDRC